MQKIALFCLLAIAFAVPASAQEQAPKPPASADEKILKIQQAILDLVEMQDRQNKLFNQEIADSRHQEAQLREECAALKAKLERIELENAEQRLSDALSRKMSLCDNAIADIERKLASTRTVSAGRLGFLKKQVHAVTGAERTRLVARRDDLVNQRTEAMALFMARILAKIQPVTTTPKSYSILGL